MNIDSILLGLYGIIPAVIEINYLAHIINIGRNNRSVRPLSADNKKELLETNMRTNYTDNALNITDPHIKQMYSLVDSYLEKDGGVMLEVGCRAGVGTQLLKSNNRELIGADIAHKTLKIFQSVGVPIESMAEHLPFKDKSFDAFICIEVIQHIHNIDMLIKELHRVLKNGKKYILTQSNPCSANQFNPLIILHKILSSSFQIGLLKKRGADLHGLESTRGYIYHWVRTLYELKRLFHKARVFSVGFNWIGKLRGLLGVGPQIIILGREN